MHQSISQADTSFKKIIEHLHHELSTLRTGRASAGLLASVMVDSFGTSVPLQNVASISVPDARTLQITPWDPGILPAIERGILAANLGLTPGNDGKVVRISIPPMTEERRKEIAKSVGQMAEQARIRVRTEREGAVKHLKKLESDGEISKDEQSALQKDLQKLVDKTNDEIKQIAEDKEREVMNV